jgi:hypothetical protein
LFKDLFLSSNFASIFPRALFTAKRKYSFWLPEDMKRALAEFEEESIRSMNVADGMVSPNAHLRDIKKVVY